MQVSNNISSFNVWKNYTNNVSSLRDSMSKLSSGSRINNAGDDPSGLAMSERLRTQSRNTSAAAGNVENKLNYLQTADSWMQKMHDMLGRMGELAVMANDGTKSDTDKDILQKEFSQMQHEIKRISGATSADTSVADVNAAGKFNGILLFQGGDAISQQVGADGGQVFTSADALDLSGESTDAMTGATSTWGELLVTDDTTDALFTAVTTAETAQAALNSALSAASSAGADVSGTVATLKTDAAAALVAGDLDAASNTLIQALSLTDVSDETDADTAAVTAAVTAAETAGVYSSVRIDSDTEAALAVTEINAAVDFISGKRADVGAEMKRMDQTLDGLRSYEENISATESRIRDVDVAKETAEMSKYNILQQVGTAMLAQANQLPQGVLQLLG